jgi:hypothetical protein
MTSSSTPGTREAHKNETPAHQERIPEPRQPKPLEQGHPIATAPIPAQGAES